MLLIGLTGSIATGKSSTSKILSQPPYNLPIIDADVIARQVVEPGQPAYKAIVAYFLPTTPDLLIADAEDKGHGKPIDRAVLGRRVFGSSDEQQKDRKFLNTQVHPAVRKAMFTAMLRAYLRGFSAAVLDVPLLFESGLEIFCSVPVVVAVSDPVVQMKRLCDRDAHLSADDASNRVKSQMDVRVKAKRAQSMGGEVVWNDADQEHLKAEIGRVMLAIQRRNPRWWSTLLWIAPPFALICGIWTMGTAWLRRRAWLRQEHEAEKDD
jgi:dephospho-CoA kinase